MLWISERNAFDGPRLRAAIISRGWTLADFANISKLHLSTLYAATSGHRVTDATAVRIFQTLERRDPMSVAS